MHTEQKTLYISSTRMHIVVRGTQKMEKVDTQRQEQKNTPVRIYKQY